MVFRPSPAEVKRHRLVLWMRQLVFQDNQERTEVELHDQPPFSGAVLVSELVSHLGPLGIFGTSLGAQRTYTRR